MGPMFRYERPQAGRQRQFDQIGVEVFGSYAAEADVETISLALDILEGRRAHGHAPQDKHNRLPRTAARRTARP